MDGSNERTCLLCDRNIIGCRKHRPVIPSQLCLGLLDLRQNAPQCSHRRREEILATLRHNESIDCIQLDRSLDILREHAYHVDLLALAELAENSVKTGSRAEEVTIVRPLALQERETLGDGALVADEEQAALAVRVGGDFVAL